MTPFEIAKLVIMVIGVVVTLVCMHRHKHPPICDSCKALRQKRRFIPFDIHSRYSCGKHGCFDRPPAFCCDYRNREAEEDG